MALPKIHTELENACGDQLAVAATYNLLKDMFIATTAAYIKNPMRLKGLPIPTTELGVAIQLVTANPPAINQPKKLFQFTNLELDLIIHVKDQPDDPTKVFAVLHFTYPSIDYEVKLNERNPARLILKTKVAADPTVPNTPTPPQDLLDQFFHGDANEYRQTEFVIRFMAASQLPEAFASLFPFPNLLGAMGAFQLLPPFDDDSIVFATDYLAVTSKQSSFTPGGPCQRGVDARSELALTITGGDHPQLEISFTPNDSSEPRPFFGTPPIVLYVPRSKLFTFSFDTVKPSISASNSDSFLLVFWEYFATVALREAAFDVLFPPPNIRIKIHLEFDIFGAAGAGITIACIRHEVLGATVRGEINPLELSLFASFDSATGLVNFSSNAEAVNISLSISSSDIFPLDVVANVIFEEVAKQPIEDAIARKINSFRVTIFDINRLGVKLPDINTVLHSLSNTTALYGLGRGDV